METVLPFIVGAIILFFGRSLFWLFVAVAGFLGGYYLAKNNLDLHPQTTLVVVACIVGVICAVISIFLQKLAIAIAGFFSGGYLAMNLAYATGLQVPMMVAFVVGGIIGALLVWVIFDWALILLSSLTGALLITQGLQQYKLTDMVILIAFVVLLIIGIAVQAAQLRKPKPAPEPART
jgi:hypothetical protein